MSHVASVCSAPIVGEARARGLDPIALTAGLDLCVADLESPGGRVPWGSFVVFAQRAAKMLGSDTLEELAAAATLSSVPRPIRRVLPRLRDSRPLFRFAARWWGPWVFRGTRGSCEVLPDGRIREVVRILPDYAPSPEFLSGIRGTLRAMPRLLGQPDALVTLEHDGREGEYVITPPPRRRRVEDGVTPPYESPRRLARILARGGDGDRDALHQDIVGLLAEHRGVVGARLVAYDEGVAVRESEAGVLGGAPLQVFPLEVAGRRIGQLELWRWDEDAHELSQDLVPWIAIAVEAGRSRALVTQLADQLVQDVRDWERVERRLARLAARRSQAGIAEAPRASRQSVDLAELVYGMALQLRMMTGDDVQLELSCAEQLAPAFCDRRELEALVAGVVGILCEIGSEVIRIETLRGEDADAPGGPTTAELRIRGSGEGLDEVSPGRFQTALELGDTGVLVTDLDVEDESEGEVGVRIRLPLRSPPAGTRLH